MDTKCKYISVTQLLLIRLLGIMNGILANLSLLIYKQPFTNKISINNTTYKYTLYTLHTYIYTSVVLVNYNYN